MTSAIATAPRSGMVAPAAIAALTERIAGRIIDPTHPDWDDARAAWNLAVDQRPEFVALATDAADVRAVVRFARTYGLQVAPQGTGHNAAPLGDLSGTILLRTDLMREVTVDVERRRVRVGAGVLWGEVTAALAPHGLTALAGSSPDVGVVGYTLGGGYSWLARKYGLASSRVTAVELVTGEGALRRVSADCDPHIFWAVRGGNGNFGVVCALEFEVLPIAEIYGGALFYPLAQAREVFTAYAEWSASVPDSVTTCVRLVRLPPLPELPDFLRGQSFAIIDGAIGESPAEAERILAPLRALVPVIDTFAPMPTADLGRIHMDPPGPVPGRGDGLILDDLPDCAIDALMAVAGPDADSSLLALDVRQLGGAVSRPDPRGGVVDHLPGRFLLFAVGIAPFPEAAEAIDRDLARLRTALAPWISDRDYSNFREHRVSARRLYSDDTLEKLLRIRAVCDPAGIFRSNHRLS